jgi:hypothetical protein
MSKHQELKRRDIVMSDGVWERLVEWGDGDPSAAVMTIVELYAEALAVRAQEREARPMPDLIAILQSGPRTYRCACARCLCRAIVSAPDTLCVGCAGCRGAQRLLR